MSLTGLLVTMALVAPLGVSCGDHMGQVLPDHHDAGFDQDVEITDSGDEGDASDDEIEDELTMMIHAGRDDNRGSYLILETTPKTTWFAKGKELLSYEAARAGVAPATLPANLAAWEGREVEIFDKNGAACPGQVVGLYGLAQALPDYRMIDHWQGNSSYDGSSPTALSSQEIANELWSLSNSPLLVAHVESVSDECAIDNSVWARPEGTDVEPLEPVALDDQDEQMVVAAMRRQARYLDIQQQFDQSGTQFEGTWSNYRGGPPQVTAFRSDTSGRTFASVTASVGEGCGDFTATMSSLYEIRYQGDEPHLVELPGDGEAYVVPTVMAEVGAEATPTVVGQNQAGARSAVMVDVVDGAQRVAQETVVPFYGCGC
jgi:hypothetical protein